VAYIEAWGIYRPHLAGVSRGGGVGARLAADQPDRVATLQLIAAGGTKANPEIMKRIKTSTTEAVQQDDIALTRKRLELLMFDPKKDVSDELVEVRHAIYHQPEFATNLHNLLCLQEMEVRTRNLMNAEMFGRIVAPTIVIWGHDNPFGDVPEAQAMHDAIAGSRLEMFAECGHWPQHEHAERYNPLSIAFLRGELP